MNLTSWRLALRIAWRDAVRHKWRSLLVLVMIALPVVAITAADVVANTARITGSEELDRRLGTADARISGGGGGRVIQGFDPDRGAASVGRSKSSVPTLADVERALGRELPALVVLEGEVRVDVTAGLARASAYELDTSSPLGDGLFRVTSGRLPSTTGEVAINARLAAKGVGLGDQLAVRDAPSLTVVGIAESTTIRGYPIVVGVEGALGIPESAPRQWLVGGGPVSWSEVRALNKQGFRVLSRAVMTNPPPESELPRPIQQWGSEYSEDMVAAIALIVVMALLEVVLLAGPAFAVGARRQQRTLALMSASGGTASQARRVVLGSGVVLGALAALAGVGLGLLIGWALLPIVQGYSYQWFGSYQVIWWHLALVASFGLLSAFLAAVVPAWIASRQDVVAVLAGRRGDRAVSLRSPLLGLVLVGFGIAMSIFSTQGTGHAEVLIAASAVIAVLGMILLVPIILVVIARLGARLPLVLRYAVRDAARHRTRTVPAVAAVAATVAGVVALSIANTSDMEQARETYQPDLPMGMGLVNSYTADVDWTRMQQIVAEKAPDVTAAPLSFYDIADPEEAHVSFNFREPGNPDGYLLDSWGGRFAGTVVVADPAMLALANELSDSDLSRADEVLAAGGAVVFTSRRVDADEVRVTGSVYEVEGGDRKLGDVVIPAVFAQLNSNIAPVQALVAPGSLDVMGATAAQRGLILTGEISKDEEEAIDEAVGAVNVDASAYVERGFRQDNTVLIMLAVLFALGAVLMLGGTLTATFLALSDARPDLATLSAVGASPGRRRWIAAAYAVVVGLVGAVLGAGIGFIPGVAISRSLTDNAWMGVGPEGQMLPSHFLDIPWLPIIGLVFVLPLLTAFLVGLSARARLPMVARLD